MKKTKWLMTILFSAAILFSVGSKAQDVNGKNFVNAGIGLGTFHLAGTGGLPLTLSIEHGFHEKISGGLYLGYIQKNFATYWKYRYVVIGARAS